MNFLPLLREIARTYQALEGFSGAHIRTFGLTPPQFDLIATLGNQRPMTCKDLGKKTLITKGTLTGVLDRLEEKGLVSRSVNLEDARSQLVGLTKEGQHLFEQIFPQHLDHLNKAFKKLSAREIDELQAALKKLRKIF